MWRKHLPHITHRCTHITVLTREHTADHGSTYLLPLHSLTPSLTLLTFCCFLIQLVPALLLVSTSLTHHYFTHISTL